MSGHNKKTITAGIKNLLKTNYKVVTDLIDFEAEIDSRLSYSENWENIKERYIISNKFESLQLHCCNKVLNLTWNFCPYCAKNINELLQEIV